MTFSAPKIRKPQISAAIQRMRLLGLVVLAGFTVAAFGQAKPSAATGVPAGMAAHVYEIPLLKNGYAFSQPSNQWSYFFELRPNVVLVGNQFVQLNFFGSPLLRQAEGSMNVYLNGVPIASRRLGGTVAGQLIQWHVDLPLAYFKLGDFNELRITSRQQTSNGPCRDIDNFGDWLRFATGSRLHLVRSDPMRYPLNSYPFPYLDNLAVNSFNVVQSHWEVPGGQPANVGEALGLASDWGSDPKYLTNGLDIHLTQGAPRPGNTISIGGAGGTGGNGAGTLSVQAGSAPGQATLVIGGAGTDGIHMARKALADPAGVALLRGFDAAIDHLRDVPARTPTTQLGIFTFAQLGIPQVHLAGAFHQHATIYIQRPLRTDLGRESTLTINFRHSASLNPLRSIVSVYINGIPVGSARLDADNANSGQFTARIPVSELAKNLWVVDLEAYHDLAAVDCSRTYDEVAWTVVEGSSFFDLRSGSLAGVPYLDSFPYLVGKDGLAPARVPIALSSGADDAQLSAAAVIAARAGQVNRQPFDWDVSLGNLPSAKSSAIVIGTFDEKARFQPWANDLKVVPAGNGQVTVNKSIDVQASEVSSGVVLQAIPTPGSNDGVTYVLLGASNAAIQRFADNLADPAKALKIGGQVAAISGDGKSTQTYSTATPAAEDESVKSESERYTPAMLIAAVVIVIILIAALLWVASQFRRRPARRS